MYPRNGRWWPSTALSILAVLLGPGLACERAAAPAAPHHPPPLLPGLLVSPRWLAEHLGEEPLVVLDARPMEPYGEGHIPGAVNLPADWTLSPERQFRMPPMPDIEYLFGSAGVSRGNSVVIYDEALHREAARLFWVLEAHGHTRVAVLEGGLAAWRAGGHPLSREVPEVPARRFIATVQPRRLATKLSTRQALEASDTLILDTRSREEYEGRDNRSPRTGHIPGALHLEWTNNFVSRDGVQRFKPAAELAEVYGDLDSDKKIITYCRRGKRAAVTYLALRLLGYDVAAYDGSWSEWIEDPSMPIER